ncbi:helix-hairpin-helix domain-containing protein [Oceanobacillus sp. J11TS1]|uniref:helix-hairpin-helix domain-containing protein n=1 Tax=Oceanobacillus sp. J11TS1 TaxID=2807191 RepID=UPI001B1D598C|nr:helix-hairpin-helix domain-containing protein [Oceanobacillus sp. J11TS1]GIO22064.1 hypothetical protein J11TS1_06450 [Oceanobacillus sp. J11TS1]
MYRLKKNIPIFIVIAVAIVFFVLMSKQESSSPISASLATSDSMESTETTSLGEESPKENQQAAVVDIKGEVMQPGVYEMEKGDRIQDIVERAGGFTENADLLQVNLAQIVQDEMVVLIPAVGQEADNASDSSLEAQANDHKIKINTATSEELVQLPGIGPAKAEAIIEHRDNHGVFQQAEDLLEISGIGEKTLENLVEHIQVP